jgi:hypothetical protein
MFCLSNLKLRTFPQGKIGLLHDIRSFLRVWTDATHALSPTASLTSSGNNGHHPSEILTIIPHQNSSHIEEDNVAVAVCTCVPEILSSNIDRNATVIIMLLCWSAGEC